MWSTLLHCSAEVPCSFTEYVKYFFCALFSWNLCVSQLRRVFISQLQRVFQGAVPFLKGKVQSTNINHFNFEGQVGYKPMSSQPLCTLRNIDWSDKCQTRAQRARQWRVHVHWRSKRLRCGWMEAVHFLLKQHQASHSWAAKLKFPTAVCRVCKYFPALLSWTLKVPAGLCKAIFFTVMMIYAAKS